LKKLLIIGRGFLGNTIANVAKTKQVQVFEASQNSGILLDIKKIKTIEDTILEIDPDIIINCSAITDVDKIEEESKNAFEVNAYGVQNISKLSEKYSKRFIHISTDSIFDGENGWYNENDRPNPINQYSKSKLKGEELIIKNNSNAVIIRTNFYGYNNEGKFLFNWILKNLRCKKPINAFEDIIFNPLEINNLSELILELSLSKFKGLIHLTGNEIFTKYEFIKKIALTLDYDINLVMKGNSKQVNFIAERPKNTSLDNSLVKKILNTKIKTLEEWLKENYSEYSKID
jgi:dTDP-4-dehydrorhamnose reductase